MILILGAVFTSKKEKTADTPAQTGNKQQVIGIVAV
ncbi:MAG TPA: hypothetical protein DCY46_03930, partial [Lactobacillus sp.]|nr:hypothetical protein [Lactobacillus sp.]